MSYLEIKIIQITFKRTFKYTFIAVLWNNAGTITSRYGTRLENGDIYLHVNPVSHLENVNTLKMCA